VDGWAEGWVGGGIGGRRDEWIGGQKERVRGEYRFSSLVKQNKKRKKYAVFYCIGKRSFFLYL
jgi:hypothetical protein